MKLIEALRLAPAPNDVAVVTVIGGGGKTSLIFRMAQEVVHGGGRAVTATTTRVAVGQMQRAPALLQLRDGKLDAAAWDQLARALDDHSHCFVVGSEVLLKGKQSGVAPEVIDAIAERAQALGIAAIAVEGDGSRTLPIKAPAAHEPVIPSCTTVVLTTLGLDALGAPLDEEHAHRPELIRMLLGLPAQGMQRLTPAQAARLLLSAEGGAKGVPASARLLPVLNKADVIAHRAPGRLIAAALAHAGSPSLLTAAGNDAVEPVLERWGPVAAVVLAAGESRRFGAAKQVAAVDGEPMVVRAARRALESGAQSVYVITGAHAEATAEALAPLLAAESGRLQLLHNEAWATGQSSSLRTALEALPPTVEALLCLPVDQPWLESVLLRRMVAEWRNGALLVAASVEGGVRGAPALFDRSTFAELAAVRGDLGGRELLRRHATRLVALPAPAATLVDVDRAQDLDSASASALGSASG